MAMRVAPFFLTHGVDKLCINVTKMTSNAEYLIPRIFNNAKNKSGRGPKPEVG